MFKLIILIGIFYLAYRVRKFWVQIKKSYDQSISGDAVSRIDDVMVKDPFCNVYFPKRNGIQMNISGKAHYFCSDECRDNFIKLKTNNNS
jgi:uncharacterized protein